MSTLQKLLQAAELDIARLSSGELIYLESHAVFAAALEASLGFILPPVTVSKLYKNAQAAALSLENNYAKRDPLSYKLIKPDLPKGYYLVGSSKYASGKLRGEIRTMLKEHGGIQNDAMVSTVKSQSQKENQLLLDNLRIFIGTAKVDPTSTNQIQNLMVKYTESLSRTGKLKARMSLSATLFRDLPTSVIENILVKHLIKLNPQMLNSLRASSLETNIENTLADIIDPKKKPVNRKASKTTGTSRSKRKPKITKDRAPSLKRVSGKHLSPLALMNAINRKLPETLRKNMGSPRLNWRTGRFGHSVKVHKIAVASNTSGLIEYSYMGYPYSIFEPGSGSKLATAARDPRRLIDVSIREVARSLTNAKFTTTRSFS